MGENNISGIESLNSVISRMKAIPFYKRRIPAVSINSKEDIVCMPITLKSDLRKLSALEMITVSKALLYEYHESSGTVGEPMSTWLTENDFNAYVNQLEETCLEIHEDDIVLIRFPYSISVPAHIFTELVKRKGACVVPVSKATKIAPYTRVLNLLGKLEVSILCCLPYEAFLLSDIAKKTGVDIKREFKKLRAICSAGEMMSESRKRRLEEAWGVPVYEFYGTTETGNLAASCKMGNLHCSEKHFCFEVLDFERRERLGFNRKGLLHITTLSKENFPLLRYDVGDIAELREGCGCGNKSPMLCHHGRGSNKAVYKGKIITHREIEEQIMSLPQELAGNFYKIISKKEEIEIHLEAGKHEDKSILKEIESRIGLDIPLKVKLFPKEGIQNISSLIECESYDKPSYFITIT
ncbi:phenylacetate-CoA ligase [Anaerobacterium chartisolvens]|uniref:Phenylacetate-CoA ligase n=1 Tax=Anaerobacterium chartisolvens TaxID=1297424 RepID=A0A369BHS5_9FIRM|nr:AMP-binding protein [Anaerobacterium chartisolvens]RCX20961.1 phenylacetate-CoA ligase [Anaerobacterium chartisolvens]